MRGETIIGNDGYAFLLAVCNPENIIHQASGYDAQPVMKIITSLLPCNIYIIKTILFLLFFASVLIISKTGELFNKQKGWLAGLFAIILTQMLYFEFFKRKKNNYKKNQENENNK